MTAEDERYYEPPDDRAGTVFDPSDPTFGPIMAALQAGDFETAAELVAELAGDLERPPLTDVGSDGVRRLTLDGAEYLLGGEGEGS